MTDQRAARTVMVTGAAQGIGRGITAHLLEHQYQVVAVDRDAEAGEELLNGYKNDDRLFFVQADVSVERTVRRLFKAVEKKGWPLHGLVNNAAIADPYNGPIEELAVEEWNRRIQTNLSSVFLCTRAAVPMLRKQGGAIVNMASTRALMSEPHTEAYSAAKGGVVALTHALANSLGPEIRVNAVSPGWIEVRDWQKKTEREEPELREIDHSQHPAGRVGHPADIASLTAYLLSDEAGFITGQNFTADGGMTKKMIYEH